MIPTVAYTGITPPALGDSVDLMIQEANSRMKEMPDVDGHAVYGLAGEELAAFGDQVDLLVVGSRSYGPANAWCSAAPRTTWSATHAAHCSSCPAPLPARARTPSPRPIAASVTGSPRSLLLTAAL
jgi:hypothetical protein